jgi:hypothetical protein
MDHGRHTGSAGHRSDDVQELLLGIFCSIVAYLLFLGCSAIKRFLQCSVGVSDD